MAGRPQAPRVITNNVMTANMLQTLEVTTKDIYDKMHDRMMWLQWLATHCLIGNNNEVLLSVTLGGLHKCQTMNHGIHQHQVVVHVHNFVDTIHADIHTLNIEGLWMQAKRKLCH